MYLFRWFIKLYKKQMLAHCRANCPYLSHYICPMAVRSCCLDCSVSSSFLSRLSSFFLISVSIVPFLPHFCLDCSVSSSFLSRLSRFFLISVLIVPFLPHFCLDCPVSSSFLSNIYILLSLFLFWICMTYVL
jgi:hypothetical protein